MWPNNGDAVIPEAAPAAFDEWQRLLFGTDTTLSTIPTPVDQWPVACGRWVGRSLAAQGR